MRPLSKWIEPRSGSLVDDTVLPELDQTNVELPPLTDLPSRSLGG